VRELFNKKLVDDLIQQEAYLTAPTWVQTLMKEKDKAELRKIIEEEIRKALQVTITWEKRRSDDGMPLTHPEIKTEESDLSAFLHIYIPRLEASLRGMQEDIDRTKSNITTLIEGNIKLVDSVRTMAEIMVSSERAIKTIADFADKANCSWQHQASQKR
jgi:hypothetical protein